MTPIRGDRRPYTGRTDLVHPAGPTDDPVRRRDRLLVAQVTDREPGSPEATYPIRDGDVECRKTSQVCDCELDCGSITFMDQGRVELTPDVESGTVPIGYEQRPDHGGDQGGAGCEQFDFTEGCP
jgi:hypothetical protein